jgi:hypothetical protein
MPRLWRGKEAVRTFSVARTRTSGPRLHRLEFVLADTNDFSYRSK